ncbi:hypothetical protein A3K73_06065 [Candidatus Pacearchaeota archaeon RBG_13_36_9]|nr:MAG: hypothetical protein A3K73_06065 [Candidatus Pacearchaeota archaeon RBG_13_36_9]
MPNSNSIQITTNYKKGVELCEKVLEMKKQGAYPFSIPDLFPDAIIPEGIKRGSLQHAIYLFYSVSLDRGRESRVVYKKCREMAELLDFSELPNLLPEYIRCFLDKNFAKPKPGKEVFGQPVKTWVENSRTLEEKFQGDPRKLKADTVEETIKNISRFRGYKEQMSWLLIKNYLRAGIWEFPLEECNIKTDRHVVRISYGTGVIEVKGAYKIRHDLLVQPLSKLYQEIIRNKKFSPIELNDAFWAIGSYCCKKNNSLYCLGNCSIGCETKPTADKKFTTLILNQDNRKNSRNLFSK